MSTCAAGNGCDLTPGLAFSGNAVFANANFDCHGILLNLGGSYNWYGVIVNFTANPSTGTGAGDSADVSFRNETGSTISSGTKLKIAYTCEGA
jgi:hypothetical protein